MLHLGISCKNHAEGCDYTSDIKSVLAHEKECPNRKVKCGFLDCRQCVRLNDVKEHRLGHCRDMSTSTRKKKKEKRKNLERESDDLTMALLDEVLGSHISALHEIKRKKKEDKKVKKLQKQLKTAKKIKQMLAADNPEMLQLALAEI